MNVSKCFPRVYEGIEQKQSFVSTNFHIISHATFKHIFIHSSKSLSRISLGRISLHLYCCCQFVNNIWWHVCTRYFTQVFEVTQHVPQIFEGILKVWGDFPPQILLWIPVEGKLNFLRKYSNFECEWTFEEFCEYGARCPSGLGPRPTALSSIHQRHARKSSANLQTLCRWQPPL